MTDPVSLHRDLRDAYLRYFDTAFWLNDARLMEERRQLLEADGLLFQSPLLEPVLPYDATEPLLDVCAQAGIPAEAAENVGRALFGAFVGPGEPIKLRRHQADAIRQSFLPGSADGRNVVVTSGTGSGKTTTLNVLSGFIPEDERIVTIEDAAELQLKQAHVLRMESRPSNVEGRGEVTIRDLVRNSLRMRPDRIVVGEVRDGAALDMLQAMNTGHDGSITTVHANSPRDALSRLETMTLMAGVDLPIRAIREQVASAVDLVVHQARLKDGSRRITHLSEVVGMEGDIITMQDVFTFDFKMGVDDRGRFRGTLKSTGLRPKFLDRIADAGVPVPPGLFAFEEFAR